MSAIYQTVLYRVEGDTISFRIEKWWMASPELPQESLSYAAVVWEKDGEEMVILLAPDKALAVADVLREFGMAHQRDNLKH